MPANYVLLEKITVGAAGAASVTFSSIPQTGYTDLIIKYSSRRNISSGSGGVMMQFNGISTAPSSSGVRVFGSGTSTGSGPIATYMIGEAGEPTETGWSSADIYIPNYLSSNIKSYSADGLRENNAVSNYMNLIAGLTDITAAISSITILPEATSTSFVQYTTFYLYGVAKLGTTPAIQPKATGGDIIETDGTYWYHAFLSSGTFTPATALSCDVLVVAGGGSGGGTTCCGVWTGGGGAGGALYTTTSIATAQTVTVGAGAAASTAGSHQDGLRGSNSVFGSLTAIGGGGGGGIQSPGLTGGSGGGWGGYSGGTGSAGTAGQGFAGGGGVGGSGGGAGAAGNDGVAGNGVAGGAGTNAYSSWLSVIGAGVSGYLAGGGAGGGYLTAGTGGLGGGGGSGTLNTNGVNAIANTGGGGGASGISNGPNVYGGNGGSGIVIVRYAI
jgi:hypothetical protein